MRVRRIIYAKILLFRYKTKQPSDSSESCSRGTFCKDDLNRLMPWIDKIWALHPYFPELMGKERTLQGAELLK